MALVLSAVPALADEPAAPVVASGALADGARWQAAMPTRWNGTLLLWSHGYARTEPEPEDAPARYRSALLDAGYAVVGSTYAEPGWALASAVPDQVAALAAFRARFGSPRRTIAWGSSMGALVTTALAERAGTPIDGALALCGSIGGAVGMMNMSLDGEYALATLLAPDAGIRLVDVDDDGTNAARVSAVLANAATTAGGRARVMLAGVLAGLPGWTTGGAKPADDDVAGQEAEMAKTFVGGVFLPRVDQERRAGGAFSWNTGVDYRAQLARSGREAGVRALYAAAGLDLDGDLARLNASTRITAKPAAVAYMLAHYTPTARPRVPLLAVQNIGDGLTSPSLQRDYIEGASARRGANAVKGLWLAGAGHCTFEPPAVLAALTILNRRLDEGRWPDAPAPFIAYTPPPMLRPCVRGGDCR